MARSMTGFGKATLTECELNVSLEIRSVNNRNRDIRIRLAPNLNFLEIPLRKMLEKEISRGYIELAVSLDDLAAEPVLKLDRNKAQVYLRLYQEIEELTGEKLESKADLLVRNKEVISQEAEDIDQDRYLQVIGKGLELALAEFNRARDLEGQNLSKDLKDRLIGMAEQVDQIASLAKKVPDYQKGKLLERLGQLLDEDLTEYYDGQRQAAELAIFADRADITEEITRLKSHLDQFDHVLDQNTSIGKNLDFIVQEMLREANTIASKANFLAITQLVVGLKTDIEKLREQVQNIE